MLDVKILSPQEILFEGQAPRVIVPGEEGVFEVGPFHRPMVSRLLPGDLIVGTRILAIKRGIVKVLHETVTAIVEPA